MRGARTMVHPFEKVTHSGYRDLPGDTPRGCAVCGGAEDGPTHPVVQRYGTMSPDDSGTYRIVDAADTLPRWYVVKGTRHTLRPDGYTAVQEVPTFYLCANVQGITSADAAVRIAHDILGTTEETATLWAYAAEDIGR